MITYFGGVLSGNIVALVGPINVGGPRGTAFYTSTNQVWVQHIARSGQYDLVSFPGDSIAQMAISGDNYIYAITSSNQM